MRERLDGICKAFNKVDFSFSFFFKSNAFPHTMLLEGRNIGFL